MLCLDEVTSASIPIVDQEAARDLGRVGEDCRGDLMPARRRLPKLLLRYDLVFYGGAVWSGAHDRWLRTEAAPQLTWLGCAHTYVTVPAARTDPPTDRCSHSCSSTPISSLSSTSARCSISSKVSARSSRVSWLRRRAAVPRS